MEHLPFAAKETKREAAANWTAKFSWWCWNDGHKMWTSMIPFINIWEKEEWQENNYLQNLSELGRGHCFKQLSELG